MSKLSDLLKEHIPAIAQVAIDEGEYSDETEIEMKKLEDKIIEIPREELKEDMRFFHGLFYAMCLSDKVAEHLEDPMLDIDDMESKHSISPPPIPKLFQVYITPMIR